jgi:arylsulfatase A-like enzyme
VRRRLSLALVVLAALAAATCAAPERRPNVLWVVWDTVRADRLSLYGHDRPTTPRLDAWAAGARVFEDCLSTAGYTLPAHGSMFTGLLPSEHCAHNDHIVLDEAHTTIAELLQGAGYRTYLYSANPNISGAQGFDQGFDVAEHPWSPRFRDRAARIVSDKLAAEDLSSELPELFRRAAQQEPVLNAWHIKAAGELAQEALLSWLAGSDDERPYFAFVNYMEAHRPLVPPRAYRERMMTPEQVERSYGVDRGWLPTWEYTFGLREYGEQELELTRATYDAALAELDDLFGNLLDALREAGLLEDTIVVLTSDHGEHLGEQHMLDHQFSVYQPLLRVPLIVHYPERFAPGRDDRPVANFDLFPTLLELTGGSPPGGLLTKSISLLADSTTRLRFAEDPAPDQRVLAMVAEQHPDWDATRWRQTLRTVVRDGRKLIRASDDRVELFDLTTDPLEDRNLVAEEAATAAELRDDLEAFAGTLSLCSPAGEQLEMTPEQIERLKALGYL